MEVRIFYCDIAILSYIHSKINKSLLVIGFETITSVSYILKSH